MKCCADLDVRINFHKSKSKITRKTGQNRSCCPVEMAKIDQAIINYNLWLIIKIKLFLNDIYENETLSKRETKR